MAKMKGADRHSRRLQHMRGIKAIDEVNKMVFTLAQYGEAQAQHSITAGSISGKNHVPSKPGEPPNADTRNLDKSIVARRTGVMQAEYAASAEYAAALEFGHVYDDGRVLEARPYMKPSADKVREVAPRIAVATAKKIVRQS